MPDTKELGFVDFEVGVQDLHLFAEKFFYFSVEAIYGYS
jgi:hypothetical protein